MAALDAIVLPTLGPWALLGLESNLLEAVAAHRCAPALLVYAMPTRMVSLGRYNPWDGPAEQGGVGAWRRLTGGRVAGSGEGWLGLALILPGRTALLSERDSAIAPAQVINRYVRGLVTGLRRIGIRAFYPGRDTVTAGGRTVAICSFEVDRAEAMLFEGFVAVERGMEDLMHDLDRLDPEGRLTSPTYDAESASTLAREIDRSPAFEELADAMIAGYSSLFGNLGRRELSAAERERATERGAAIETSEWLRCLTPDPQASASVRTGAQLGTIEARLGIMPGGSIKSFQLLGDFIANSMAIGRLENALRGKPLELDAVSDAVMQTLGDGDNFILGAGDLSSLARLISRAQ